MEFSRRDLAKGAGTIALAAFLAPRRAFGNAHANHDALAYVDSELRPAARAILAASAKNLPSTMANIPAMREGMKKRARLPSAEVAVVEQRIPGRKGMPDVRIYVINANPGPARPGILHTHGGGYIGGSAGGDVAALQEMAKSLDAVIVSVDYRLAPETTYVGSVEDNYAGLKWMYDHAAEIGVDRERIAVTGESAGGGHAALLAITARDRGEVPVIFQSLVYPMLDDRTASSRPVRPHIGQLIWTSENNRLGWHAFLGQVPGTTKVPAAAVPARNANLAGLPPAWIGVGAIDLFVDEDIEYARRLVDAAVPTELLVVPGAFHAFNLAAGDTSVARRFNEARLQALRRAFQIPV